MMKCLWIWQCNDNYTQISPLYIQDGHNNDPKYLLNHEMLHIYQCIKIIQFNSINYYQQLLLN